MRVVLARHGNTFAPGDKVVMAGLSNDLPLVESGEKQAEVLGKRLEEEGIIPTAAYCSKLQRSRHFAELALAQVAPKVAPTADPRLNELDYGGWTGLADSEIIEKFGQESSEKWQNFSQWPQNAGWGGSDTQCREEVKAFAEHLAASHQVNDVVLVVSHSGRLRYFLDLFMPPLTEESCFDYARRTGQFPEWKMKTGHFCLLEFAFGHWAQDGWNLDPASPLPKVMEGFGT